jgi:ribose/xylose/arabinose/galactoside ABC-type transport system permease subunit
MIPSAEQSTAEPQEPAVPRSYESTGLRRFWTRDRSITVRSSLTFIAFLAIFCIYTAVLGSTFQNASSRLLDLHTNVPVLLLGMAVLMTLLAGQFDLSVASMATLTTYLTVGLTINQHWPFWVVVIAGGVVGIAGGLLNGFVIVRLRVNAFIATLGTGGMFLGLSEAYSNGQTLTPLPGHAQLPAWFAGINGLGAFGAKPPVVLAWSVVVLGSMRLVWLATRRRRGDGWAPHWVSMGALVAAIVALAVVLDISAWVSAMSWLSVVLLAVAASLAFVVNHTPFGRRLVATGSNAPAASLAGVKTERATVIAFVLGGFLAALAGVALAAINGSAAPDVAGPYLLPAFAAAFLSTVIFSKQQRFTVWGTITGGLFLVWVAQGLVDAGVSYNWTDFVNGAVLVAAVALQTFAKSHRP